MTRYSQSVQLIAKYFCLFQNMEKTGQWKFNKNKLYQVLDALGCDVTLHPSSGEEDSGMGG